MWSMKRNSSVRVTLINPDPVASYTGMLPALIAGKVSPLEAQINLFKLCRSIGARLILDDVKRVDKKNNFAICTSGRKVFFDAVSINVGSNSITNINGFEKYGVSVRPLVKFEEKWRTYQRKLVSMKKAPTICLIGGGIAAAELAFAMRIALNKKGYSDPKISIIERSRVFKDLNSIQKNFLIRKLASENIEIKEFSPVLKALNNSVLLENGSRVLSDFTVSCVGPSANPI